VFCNVSILLARRHEFYLTESKRLLANSGADLNANTKRYTLLYKIDFQLLRRISVTERLLGVFPAEPSFCLGRKSCTSCNKLSDPTALHRQLDG
jgi:hypothetical protein